MVDFSPYWRSRRKVCYHVGMTTIISLVGLALVLGLAVFLIVLDLRTRYNRKHTLLGVAETVETLKDKARRK